MTYFRADALLRGYPCYVGWSAESAEAEAKKNYIYWCKENSVASTLLYHSPLFPTSFPLVALALLPGPEAAAGGPFVLSRSLWGP